jgi:hypothetical protein
VEERHEGRPEPKLAQDWIAGKLPSGAQRRTALIAVFIGKIFSKIGFELAVVGVDGGA